MAYPDGFLDFLEEVGFLTSEEVADLLARAATESTLLGRLLLRERVVAVRQMVHVLRLLPASSRRIGDLIVDLGYASREEVERVAAMQTVPRHDVYDLLLQSELIERDELFEALLEYVRERELVPA